jgi:hypothetical protein
MFIRRSRDGRCPVCGVAHAACGGPSSLEAEPRIEEVTAVGGPLKKYRYTGPGGHETVLKLNATDAARYGLADDDLVHEQEDAETPTATVKGRRAAPNKVRTSAPNKTKATDAQAGGDGGGA